MALANRAKSLREDELLNFVFDKLEKNETEAMLTSADRDARELNFWAVQGIRKVREALRIIFDDGKVAGVELADFERQQVQAQRRRA